MCYLDTNAQLPPASSGGFFWSHYKDILVYFLQHVEGREFLFLAVPWEMTDVFSLKFQRNKPKNVLAMDPAKGKTG